MMFQRDATLNTTDVSSSTTSTTAASNNSNPNNLTCRDSTSFVSGDTSIECIVCYDTFGSERHKHALVLSCGHTTCRSCVEQLVYHDGASAGADTADANGVNNSNNNKHKQGPGRVQCVVCRAQTMLGPDGVDGLKQNTGVAAVVQHMEQQRQQQKDHDADHKRCQGCKGERAVEVFCQDCKAEMCMSCFASIHAVWVSRFVW